MYYSFMVEIDSSSLKSVWTGQFDSLTDLYIFTFGFLMT